jgi:hypothetical protein
MYNCQTKGTKRNLNKILRHNLSKGVECTMSKKDSIVF